jgi:lysophospholipase L1-like esterase
MQQIITRIKNAGKSPFLAQVPKAFSPREYLNPLLEGYNAVVIELTIENSLGVLPPDFYSWFENHPEEMDDDLHPNGTGYISMANLWYTAIISQIVPLKNSKFFGTLHGSLR